MATVQLPYPPTANNLDPDEVRAAYERLRSVHKVAQELGSSHSRIHRLLTSMGAMKGTLVSDGERERIRRAYLEVGSGSIDLAALAAELGRNRATVCRVAQQMGLSSPQRAKPAHVRHTLASARDLTFAERGHPRGFQSRTHTDAARKVIGEKSRDAWLVAKTFEVGLMSPKERQRRSDLATARAALPTGESAYTRARGGRRADIGPMYFRSSWEANYARYLNWLQARGEIDGWEYEPETFWFERIKRGVRSYKPDFRIHEKGKSYFVEVKGWMDPRSATKLKRMKKYHPHVEVRVVGAKEYRAISSAVSRLIAGWEQPGEPSVTVTITPQGAE